MLECNKYSDEFSALLKDPNGILALPEIKLAAVVDDGEEATPSARLGKRARFFASDKTGAAVALSRHPSSAENEDVDVGMSASSP